MSKYICVSEEMTETSLDGKISKIREKRALYYLREIGRGRVYRQNVLVTPTGMKKLEFSRLKNAQDCCDSINEAYNDDFKPELVL